MDNWYKRAKREPGQRSRFMDDTGAWIEGPDMSKFQKTPLEKLKRWLEEKHPNVNWTVEAVVDFYNKNFNENPPRKQRDLNRNVDFVDDDLI